jgi:ubiquinol-cytochrome c reductase cytochrome c subunit
MTRGRLTRPRVARVAALAGATAALVASSTVLTRAQAAPVWSAPRQMTAVEAGRDLFVTGCSSCHGLSGKGTHRGPDLSHAGAAAADFYLSTGRMPLANPRDQPERKPTAYSREDIDRLVAYVASLGPGPAIPTVSPGGALADGSRLYTENCAACHSSAGAGGALGQSIDAPPLLRATNVQIAEAMRIGPGAMPVFGPETLDEIQLASIVRYVRYLRHPRDRGGNPLGHIGPVPEGFVGWIIGLGAMLAAAYWIGTRD